jgi:hypothetical protein
MEVGYLEVIFLPAIPFIRLKWCSRKFTEQEELPNGPHVAVISQALWERRFASERQIVGKTISLNGDRFDALAS